jgi:hypothetical protein
LGGGAQVSVRLRVVSCEHEHDSFLGGGAQVSVRLHFVVSCEHEHDSFLGGGAQVSVRLHFVVSCSHVSFLGGGAHVSVRLRVVWSEQECDSFRLGAEASREPHQLRRSLRSCDPATATSAAIIATSTAASTPTVIFDAATIVVTEKPFACVKLLPIVGSLDAPGRSTATHLASAPRSDFCILRVNTSTSSVTT